MRSANFLRVVKPGYVIDRSHRRDAWKLKAALCCFGIAAILGAVVMIGVV